MTEAQAVRSRKRLERFLVDLLEPVGRSERRHWGGVYVRSLLLNGERKSIEPLAQRLPEGNVQAMQGWAGGCTCRRVGPRTRNGAKRRASRRSWSFARSGNWPWTSLIRSATGDCPTRSCWLTPAMGTGLSFVKSWKSADWPTPSA